MVARKEPAKSNKPMVTARGYAKIKEEMVNENLQTILLDEERSTQDLYVDWKAKVNDIVRRNQTFVKKRNPHRNVKLLLQTKKRLKKQSTKIQHRETAIAKIHNNQ